MDVVLMPSGLAREAQPIQTSSKFYSLLGSGRLFEYNFAASGLSIRPKLIQHAISNEDPGAGS